MRHPFSRLAERSQRHALVLLGVATFALTTFLAVLGSPLESPAAARGIVSFELAGSAEVAAAILDSWSDYERNLARLNLWLDYLYLVTYPLFLSLACARVAGRLAGGAGRAGQAISWAVLAAAPLDAVENAALLRVLDAGPSDASAGLAWACAIPKFALVVTAIAFVALGLVWMAVARRGRTEPA